MSLLQDLQRLAATVLPHEIPDHYSRDQVLAALIKTLDHEGVKVADELFPKPEEQAAAATVEAVAPAAAAAVVDELGALLERAKAAVEQLEGHPAVDASKLPPAGDAVSAGSESAPPEPASSAPTTHTTAPSSGPSSGPSEEKSW
jgi:hypothetical protein